MPERTEGPSGPLDIPTLNVLAQRARTHPVVTEWQFQPDSLSPRLLELKLDETQYPDPIEEVRVDIRWFEGGDYSVHYLESVSNEVWQCRWDCHPKPNAPRAHFHPPPNAGDCIDSSPIESGHHLAVLFAVLDWVGERVEKQHDS